MKIRKFIYIALVVLILIFTACSKLESDNVVSEVTAANNIATATTVKTPASTPEATPTPAPTATPMPHVEVSIDGRPWYVRVDTYNQLISVYALDENDEYTRLINQFITSAGKRHNYTKKVFQVLNDDDRYRWKFFSTFGGGYCEYVTRIYKPFLFHSVMFETKSEDTLMGDTYSELTFPDSHGCMRLMPQDAKWIFDNCIDGTYVEVIDGKANPDLTQSYMPPPLIEGEIVPVHEPFGGEIRVPAVVPNWDNFPSDGGWVYDPEVYG